MATRADMQALAGYVNQGGETNSNMYYELTADIDLGGKEGIRWTPIGGRRIVSGKMVDNTFRGYFDGKGHTISNMYVTNQGEEGGLLSMGLFCSDDFYSVVANLHLDSTCRIEVKPFDMALWLPLADSSDYGSREFFAYGIAAIRAGKVISCTSACQITVDYGFDNLGAWRPTVDEDGNVSVLVTTLHGSLCDCRNEGDIVFDGSAAVDSAAKHGLSRLAACSALDLAMMHMGLDGEGCVNKGDMVLRGKPFDGVNYVKPAVFGGYTGRTSYLGNQGTIYGSENGGVFNSHDELRYVYNTAPLPFYCKGTNALGEEVHAHLYDAGMKSFYVDTRSGSIVFEQAYYLTGNPSYQAMEGLLPMTSEELSSPYGVNKLNEGDTIAGFCLPGAEEDNQGYPVFRPFQVRVHYIGENLTDTCHVNRGALVPIRPWGEGVLVKGCYTDRAFSQEWDEKMDVVRSDMDLYVLLDQRYQSLGDTAFAGGDGSKENPFLIATPGQLAYLGETVAFNADASTGKYYRLTSDMDLQGMRWIPIREFRGYFDGDGYRIRNMKVQNADRAGLFGTVSRGTVANLHVDSSCSVQGTELAGSVAGYVLNSVIENCHSAAKVECRDGNAGGLVGHFLESYGEEGALRLCSFSGFAAGNNTGGLVGYIKYQDMDLFYCYSTGSVLGTGPQASAGGFIGKVDFQLRMYGTGLYFAGEVSLENADGQAGKFVGSTTRDGFSLYCTRGFWLGGIDETIKDAEEVTEEELRSPDMLQRLNPSPTASIYAFDEGGANRGFPIINPARVNVHFDNLYGMPMADYRAYLCKTWRMNRLPVPSLTESYQSQCADSLVWFEGWATERKADPLWLALDSFPMESEIELHSIWRAKTFFTDGSSISDNEASRDLIMGVPYVEFSLPEFSDTRYSYNTNLKAEFHAWSPDTANPRSLSHSDLVERSATLYALWSHNVYFNAMGGGLAAIGDSIVEGDSSHGENFRKGDWMYRYVGGMPYFNAENPGLPVAEKDGYELGGWYTDPVYSEPKDNDDIVPLKLRDTLYADWADLVWVNFETYGMGTPVPPRQYYPLICYYDRDFIEYNNNLPFADDCDTCLFMYWVDSGGNEISGGDYVPAENHTLFARYACSMEVRFDVQGGEEIASGTYYTNVAWLGRYGTFQNSGLPRAYRDGFCFGGWFFDPACTDAVDVNDLVRPQDTVLFAKWEGPVVVEFEVGEGQPLESRTYYTGFAYKDDVAGNPGLPSAVKEDAVFEGWYADPGFQEKVSETSLVTAERTVLYAHFGEKISVAFECNEGNELAAREYYTGFAYLDTRSGNPGLPRPSLANSKDSLDFGSWYTDPGLTDPVDETSIVDAAVEVLYAGWNPAYQRVRFEPFGDEVVEDRVYRVGRDYGTYGSGNPGLPTLSRENTSLLGWYADPEYTREVDAWTTVTTDVDVLYARWSNWIEVRFETFGGSEIEPRTYETGFDFRESGGGMPSDPDKGDALFLGWYADPEYEQEVDDWTEVTETMTCLYAKWGEKVKIVFVDYTDPDYMFEEEDYYHNIPYRESPNKGLYSPRSEKAPWVFVGWHAKIRKMEVPVRNDSLVPQDYHALHARWCVRVKFETFGGNHVEDRLYSPGIFYGESPNEGLPETAYRPGYLFKGWYSDSACRVPVKADSVVKDAAHTLYAGWEEIPATLVTVDFVVNGGDAMEPRIYQADGLAYGELPNPGLPVPAREDFCFAGWYADAGFAEAVTDSSLVPAEDHSLYARWTEKPLAKVQVSFETNGGDPVGTREYFSGLAYGEAPNTGLPVPQRTDYHFAGWYADAGYAEAVTDSSLVPEEDHTLYAQWRYGAGNIGLDESGLLRLWPNPVREILYWSFEGEVDGWQVWDGKGRIRLESDGLQRQMDVRELEDAWFVLVGFKSGKVLVRVPFVKL